KESAIVAPLLCVLSERPASGAPPTRRRRTILYAGHAGVLALYLLARLLVLGSLGVGGAIPFVDNPAAAAGPLAGRLTALGAVARYAVLLLWPARLSADYSYDQIPVVRTLLDPWPLAGLALVLLVIAGGGWLLRRRPACGHALLWIGLSAALTCNLVVFIGTLLADRLMYLPSVGLCLLLGCSVAAAGEVGRKTLVAPFVGLLLVTGGAARTLVRLPEWKDDFVLYRSAALVSPRSARIRYNLGNAHLRRGEYAEALTHYHAALAIYPEFNDARENLGMALLESGRPKEAREFLSTASARDPHDADLAVNLGSALQALGELQDAEVEFRRALEIDPRSSRAWNNLGTIALRHGDATAAVERLRRAVDLDPEVAIYRVNLGDALGAASRTEEADAEFEAAYRLEPDLAESRRGLGEVALRRGDQAAAEREFRAAASAAQPSARASNFLGYLLAARGEDREAAAAYEKALALDPTLFDAHRSLGLLCALRLGEPRRAAEHLKISLELSPGQEGAEGMRRLLRQLEMRTQRKR
ncbi:MAG TPA: tetratricopeptide repeat protein, partial [Candidatus Polarisedimenticolia bacterium]|nr:tetratricopeptide repeat protein [Candidatus Polarisedimenticolia bacterium]